MTPWWVNPSLVPGPAGLLLDGVELARLGREVGTPLYVYSGATIERGVASVADALDAAGVRRKIWYAMKANRNPAVLALIRRLGLGVDTCSPREVELALQCGFEPHEISFNAGMLSDWDLGHVAAAGCRVILDSFSTLARYGARVPAGTPVGLRFDPQVLAGYRARTHLAYGQAKFGFEPGSLDEVVAAARAAGLDPVGLHIHLGWGLGEDALPEVEAAFAGLAGLARKVDGLRWLNLGGGLGARYRAEDRPLPLDAWSDAVRRHLAPLDLEVHVEPGTAIVGAAGVLLAEVNTVEARRGITWVGVDAGHALNPCPALYGIPLAVIAADRPLAPSTGSFAVVGNINEAGDVWEPRAELPDPAPGDILALYPCGAYAESMASDHCLRGGARSRLL